MNFIPSMIILLLLSVLIPYIVQIHCMVTHIIARVWINRVRLPVLHVVRRTGKIDISLSAFVPENLVFSRDGLGSPVPRQPAHLHTQAESGAYLRDSCKSRLYIFVFGVHAW